ncbi:MAG: hypothetical protein OXC99_10635 [Chloroflexi bacterium]|nr:hypothetical protein [Chloroflexota bacterium]
MSGLPVLRRYQSQVAFAVFESARERKGLTFTVEIARQGGKNEISAQTGVWLLSGFSKRGGSLVKAAPTFSPQALVSLRRLRERLKDARLPLGWRMEGGNIVRVGRAQQTFLSAEPSANVVGATADVLLEMDEAQDVDAEKFFKEFRPMGATGNATTALYGTPWDGATLLESMAAENVEMERRDGIRRHFAFDWEAVAAVDPLYRAYVEGERERLGGGHPLFRTQYRLLPIAAGEGMFSRSQLARLEGSHGRLRGPRPGCSYVAGVDVAGEPWGESSGLGADQAFRQAQGERPAERGGRDSTVVTIGEVEYGLRADAPVVRVVEHYRWTGEPHHALTGSLVDLLQRRWRCRRVVVDATGLGTGIASGLVRAMGGAVEPFVFTAGSKSSLGFDLLAAVNSGRLSAYAGDGSAEHVEFRREMELAQARYRVNQTMDFFVEASRGHDDYLMSLALAVRAAGSAPRAARGRVAFDGG